MPSTPRYKIYYGPGTTEDNCDVQIIAQWINGERMLIHSHDYYWQNQNGIWEGADDFGLKDQLLNNFSNVKRVMAGRTISESDFQKILQTASKDN